ncbi:MAG: hypothetical protein RL385_3614, partial [Pseudomonadota bacterium]
MGAMVVPNACRLQYDFPFLEEQLYLPVETIALIDVGRRKHVSQSIM